MGLIEAKAHRVVPAPPDRVYGVLSDMHQHQRFLPPAFTGFHVEQGGVGAGTITRFSVTAGGRSREYVMRVDEPEPGRVLTESDQSSSLVTTFTVDPAGTGSRVQIATRWQGAGGVGGFFERMFAPRVMRSIYQDELQRLSDYVCSRPDGEARAAASG